MADAPTPSQSQSEGAGGGGAAQLPPETLAFAHRMFDAARAGDTALLAEALDAGLPADLANEKGNTLLMLAAYAGHAATASALLARGADADRTNAAGQTPLAGAVFRGARPVVRALLAARADPRRGVPSAIQAARLFAKHDLLADLGATDDDLREEIPGVPGPPR